MQHNETEVEQLVALLKQIARMSEEAALTGNLDGGEKRLARRYNLSLARLEALGALPQGAFEPLPESPITFGEIAVEANLTAHTAARGVPGGRREGDHEPSGPGPDFLVRIAPFLGREELGELVRTQLGQRRINPEMVAMMAPFLERSDLAHLLRASLAPEAPEPPEPPEPPEAPEPPEPPQPAEIEEAWTVDTSGEEVAEVERSIAVRDLLATLTRPDLQPEDLERALEDLRRHHREMGLD